jgi:hypothetical protein
MFTGSGWPPGLRRLGATGLAAAALLALALPAGQAHALPRSRRILVLHAGPDGSPIKAEYPGYAGMALESYALQGDGSLQRADGTPFQAAPSGAEGAGVLGPALLARFDTLLITEADIATLFTESDRRRLLAWVAEGHGAGSRDPSGQVSKSLHDRRYPCDFRHRARRPRLVEWVMTGSGRSGYRSIRRP